MNMDMNMSSGSMPMSSNASMATGPPTMAGMSERGCKISVSRASRPIRMLWNWYTIDTCFFSANWKITSNAMFAGSVIGVVALTLFVEFLRRVTKEYDKRLLVKYRQKQVFEGDSSVHRALSSESTRSKSSTGSEKTLCPTASNGGRKRQRKPFRPTFGQQMIRTALHTAQFALAYLIMLLAMYYNGFVIIGIVIGTFIGFFIFSWESTLVDDAEDEVTPISCH